MPPSQRIFLPVLVILATGLACAVPAASPTPDSDAIHTFIAQTLTAASTQTASATLPPSPTAQPPIPTFAPQTPTLTLTATVTVGPIFTPTPAVPQISVSVPTNCRSGPGKAYPLNGALLVGQTAEVSGRDPSGNYWYIRNPDSANEFCWVWGQYATLTGNTGALPIFTPPPTPTPTFTPTPAPNFDPSFTGLENCTGNWWVEIKFTNTGSIPFRSMSLTIKDKDTDVVMTNLSDGFTDRDGCLKTTTKDVLEPGLSFVVSAPSFSYDPTGHKLNATILLCSHTGQGGTCVTRVIGIKP